MSNESEPEYHAQRAHEFYLSGQYDKALDAFKQALAHDPAQSDWHFAMGLTLAGLARFSEAAQSFSKTLELRGEDSEAQLHLGLALLHAGQYEKSIAALEALAQLDPQNEPSFCHRILCYAYMGQHEKAEEMFYQARLLVDECPFCYAHLATSLSMRGLTDRAIWCWRQAMTLDPIHVPNAAINLARLYCKKGQHLVAIDVFQDHLRRFPDDISALMALGNLLLDQGNAPQAAEKFRHVLDLDPICAEAHMRLGQIALAAGHTDAAAVNFESCARHDPDLPGAHLALASIALAKSNVAAAQSHLRQEMDIPGQTAFQLLELARLLFETNLCACAAQAIDTLLSRPEARSGLGSDKLAQALLIRAVSRLRLGQIQPGIKDCRASLSLVPSNPLAAYNLALAYHQAGNPSYAQYWIRKSQELAPDDRDIQSLAWRIFWTRLCLDLKSLITFTKAKS
jgi:tetratricopeptide (TPR) repeat protein